jgi:hypothetical protein
MAHQAAGTTATTEGIAPPMRIEPCARFRLDHTSEWVVCDACGWLEDDHAPAEHGRAVVTELPRRQVRLPERKAS